MGVDGEKAMIALLQSFSDKYVTTLSVAAFTVYPMHNNVLKFSEITRREHICSGPTILRYLSVTFSVCDDH